jgi:proline iminopeptidase
LTAVVFDREHRIDVPGGSVWCGTVGTGPGIPLLLLHGGPGLPSDYLFPLAKLASDRQVIFYDQLGCGRSERPDYPGLWRIERFVQELRAVRSALGLPRFHLFGHSWGSMLAIDYALTRPDGVVSLVLASPAISMRRWIEDAGVYRSELPAEVREQLSRHNAAGALTSPEYAEATAFYYRRHVCRMDPWPELLEQAEAGFNATTYGTMWGANELNVSGNLARYDRSGRLKELRLPALFTCGRYDEATPDTTSLYSSLLDGSRVEVFEESAHMPQLEEEERYLAVLSRFLFEQDGAV